MEKSRRIPFHNGAEFRRALPMGLPSSPRLPRLSHGQVLPKPQILETHGNPLLPMQITDTAKFTEWL